MSFGYFYKMYQLPHFTETDRNNVLEFMYAHPFITLIGNDGLTTAATQVPVLLEEQGDILKIRGHIMRHTDHHIAFTKNSEVLALFTGANCYISASWYNERGIGGSWNYITVHARGTITLFDDAETIRLLTDMTHHFERHQPAPELVENMSESYLSKNVKAITAFEITITSIHPIFKLSQNRNNESYRNIVSQLVQAEDPGAAVIASEMKKRRAHLF